MKVTVQKIKYNWHPFIGIVHGPGIILKMDCSWRNVNGIHFRWTKGRRVWLEIR